MNVKPKTPRTEAGGELPAIQPGRNLDGAVVQATSTAKVTENSVGTSGVYIFCESLIHVRLSGNGDAVDSTWPPIDARAGTVLYCDVNEKVSFMKKSCE